MLGILEQKLNSVYNCLSHYDYFDVMIQNKHFKINGIIIFHKQLDNIGFDRQFSEPIIPEHFVTDANENKDGTFNIKCGDDEEYVLKPLHEKENNDNIFDIAPCNISLDSFMDEHYVDVEHDSKNNFYLYVNMAKVGRLSTQQKYKIEAMINHTLGGSSEKYQCCRTIAFSIKVVDNVLFIFAHIFNIENHECLNAVQIYETGLEFVDVSPFEKFIQFALHIH
ncbi:MAG: hypothetical protein IJA34_00280 [Lachnospiraceae bacterium]|nr:hypothetical protein [Lachnospiraceae bacterium]